MSDVKNIYKSPKDKDGVWTWVNKYPEDAEDAAENEVTAQYAVLVRNIKSPDSRKKLKAHSIVVQSPWLKTALGKILEDYPGVVCELERLIFEAPFQPFVHRWKGFVKYRERENLDDTTKEHLTILHNILQYEMGHSIKVFEDYVEKGVVTYENLWMVFQPGAPVLAAHKGPLSAFELEDTTYTENRCGKFVRLRCDCIDYDGKAFGRCQENIDISEFVGTKRITELSAYPLTFHPRPDEIRDSLIKRGQLFEDLAGHHYKAYSGMAITWDIQGNELPIEVSGRIVVDIGSFNRFSPINFMRHRRLRDWKSRDRLLLLASKARHVRSGGELDGILRLSPYHKMLARCRTGGYSLKLKKWLDFFVEQVGDIQFSNDAFNKLVLPDDQKELIMAFSESQLEGCAFDDVISGKGKGVICLLSVTDKLHHRFSRRRQDPERRSRRREPPRAPAHALLGRPGRGPARGGARGGRGGGAKATELSDADLDELSGLDLNGRQIKNILKTAQLLASRKKTPLKRSFIDTILAIEKRRPEVHHD
ncbi:hypothetical protein PG994_005085 [Apiospora phragmitis]|uniref:DUF7025 domain-containing protein n=1 Tax=Apiospora phragmitis TaxID=2905665 RepID=A0ABR1VSG0_9PEZI